MRVPSSLRFGSGFRRFTKHVKKPKRARGGVASGSGSSEGDSLMDEEGRVGTARTITLSDYRSIM